jgi:hypothetical protein
MTIPNINQQDLSFNEGFSDLNTRPSNGSKIFSIKAYFGDGYVWSKLLNSIKKYSQLLYEAYWYGFPYHGDGSRSISKGEYKIETSKEVQLRKSLTWLQKTENVQIEMIEEYFKKKPL